MGKGRNYWEHLIEESRLDTEIIPAQPIVEISGSNRVLIENHFGVIAYSTERIQVRVKFGFLCVCGCSLDLVHMSKERLIIRGKIQMIVLNQEGKK